jgi:hypothetical protein
MHTREKRDVPQAALLLCQPSVPHLTALLIHPKVCLYFTHRRLTHPPLARRLLGSSGVHHVQCHLALVALRHAYQRA